MFARFNSLIGPIPFSHRSRSYPEACVALSGLVALALIGVGCQTLEREEALPAKVVRIKGAARAGCGTNSWQTLKVGQRLLAPGWLVQTAADSYADMILQAQVPIALPPTANTAAHAPRRPIMMRLQPDAILQLNQLTGRRRSRRWDDNSEAIGLSLKAGKLFVNAPTGRGSTFEINLTSGVLRGTNSGNKLLLFIFQTSADGVVQSGIGEIIFEHAQTKESVRIPAGHQYDSRTGQLTRLPAQVEQELVGPITCPFCPVIWKPVQFPAFPQRKF